MDARLIPPIARTVHAQVLEVAARHERALADLRNTAMMMRVDDKTVAEMLAVEAERDCGVASNISTAVIGKVTKRILFGDAT